MTKRLLRMTAVLFAVLGAVPAAAQPRPAAPRPADPPPIAVADERSAQNTRQRLRETLEQYPPSVAQVLRLDPSLLRSDYLAPYPTLAAFLAQHPEVAHNPVYFLGEARFNGADGTRKQALDTLENILAGGSLLVSSGSRPTRYYQPVAKLFVPVAKHAALFAEWRYYGYGEAFYLYEAFRTHLFTTGLRLTR